MNMMRVALARLISPWIVAAFGFLALKLGTTIDPELVNQTVEVVVGIILWVVPAVLSLNGFVHKFLNRWINPLDTASSKLVPPSTIGVSTPHPLSRNRPDPRGR